MAQIGVRELKNQATEILRAVREHGAEYIVTYRGAPVAYLLPVKEELRHASPAVITAATRPSAEIVAEIDELLATAKALRPENRRMMKLMRAWMAEPDNTDEALG